MFLREQRWYSCVKTTQQDSVPDGETTVMLLGAALRALGMVRRFLMG
jgi:hypothetical protein